MKYLKILSLFAIFLLTSCASQPENSGAERHPFVALFPDFASDTIQIGNEDALNIKLADATNHIPLQYKEYVQGLPQVEITRTIGLLPFGKKEIGENHFLLTAAQNNDYGFVVWGIVFHPASNTVVTHRKLAHLFGDFGTLQESLTILRQDNKFKQVFETCNSEVDMVDGRPQVLDTQCNDSLVYFNLDPTFQFQIEI